VKTLCYHRPTSLDEAMRLLAADPDAQYLAGGTDLLVGATPPQTIVSLRNLPGLSEVTPTRIGALATVGEVVRRGAPALLVEAARRLGSEQIRSVATVGGNLCRAAPCADLALPLLCLEAVAEIAGPRGVRETPLDEFFRGPGITCLERGELLTAVRWAPPDPSACGVFLKKVRVRMDLSIASVAVLLERQATTCRRVRIAAGSVAPTPLRLREVEALLEGRPITDELLAEAGALASRSVAPITDVRSTAEYRRHVTGVFVRRAVAKAMGGADR